MNKAKNSRLLSSIGTEIQMWEHGRNTPRKTCFYVAFFILVIAGMAAGSIVMSVHSWLYLTGTFLWILAARSCCLVFLHGWAEDDWPGAMDRRLAHYQPCNLVAWNYLQETARRKGHLDVHDLKRWYESECLTVCPAVKKKLLFLENTPDKACQKKE